MDAKHTLDVGAGALLREGEQVLSFNHALAADEVNQQLGLAGAAAVVVVLARELADVGGANAEQFGDLADRLGAAARVIAAGGPVVH